MNKAKLKAYTQSVEDSLLNCESLVGYFARVSNESKEVRPVDTLIDYLIKNKHWSPFEMVNAVIEVETSRDIARQLLRHRSFSFQEFSQRYSATQTTSNYRETRLQDWKNRQNSLPNDDLELDNWFIKAQQNVKDLTFDLYDKALKKGIAKEQARALLPEGLTSSRLFVNGSIRSWIHYIELRTQPETQAEHRDLALKCSKEIAKIFPKIKEFINNA